MRPPRHPPIDGECASEKGSQDQELAGRPAGPVAARTHGAAPLYRPLFLSRRAHVSSLAYPAAGALEVLPAPRTGNGQTKGRRVAFRAAPRPLASCRCRFAAGSRQQRRPHDRPTGLQVVRTDRIGSPAAHAQDRRRSCTCALRLDFLGRGIGSGLRIVSPMHLGLPRNLQARVLAALARRRRSDSNARKKNYQAADPDRGTSVWPRWRAGSCRL
jgi:hypothetical protein